LPHISQTAMPFLSSLSRFAYPQAACRNGDPPGRPLDFVTEMHFLLL
jgi:hypothetical protein